MSRLSIAIREARQAIKTLENPESVPGLVEFASNLTQLEENNLARVVNGEPIIPPFSGLATIYSN